MERGGDVNTILILLLGCTVVDEELCNTSEPSQVQLCNTSVQLPTCCTASRSQLVAGGHKYIEFLFLLQF